MDPEVYNKSLSKIYKRYPEFTGSKPSVKKQNPISGNSKISAPIYLWIFRKTVKTEDNQSFQRVLRILLNSNGKILKVSTSR